MVSKTMVSAILLVVAMFLTTASCETVKAKGDKLFVMLVDGFRWDYFDNFEPGELPGFELLKTKGVKSDYLQPVFSSLSFVQYYSMMTGLYAEDHGMVHNYMWDPIHEEYFLIGDNEDQYHSYWWEDGEPLWITAEMQDKNAYMWYWNGCEVEIHGHRPTYCSPYQSTPNPSLANFTLANDQGIALLANGSADFIGTYLERVDDLGHKEGPDGATLKEYIKELDAEILRVQTELQEKNLFDEVNMIIFSDHGMAYMPAEEDRCIDVFDYIQETDLAVYTASNSGPVVLLWPAEDKLDEVYNALTDVHEGLITYKKEDIPDRYHYKNHYRISPIVLEAKQGYAILRPGKTECGSLGYHGYDNALVDMRGIFLARGPDFKKGYKQDGFINVELYQMMCHLLHLDAAPNNGTWDTVKDMLILETSAARALTSYPAVLLLASAWLYFLM